MLFGQDITLRLCIDEATARSYLSLLAERLNRPPRDAELQLEGLAVIETPTKRGADSTPKKH